MSPEAPLIQRTIVYVDGFNLYFGILKGNPGLKWFNLESFMKALRPSESIEAVRYFTAEVHPLRRVCEERDRQKRYLSALKSCEKTTVILGNYQMREVGCRGSCGERYNVPEEKKTDVGIAVSMISDSVDDLMDRIVLVSADSDLEPAVGWIRKRFRHIKITVYIPQDPSNPNVRRNDNYAKMGVEVKFFPCADIRLHQFPQEIELLGRRKIQRPNQWR